MNSIFANQVINPYRASGKRYSIIRGHTGVDLNFKTGDELHSHITGQVIAKTVQPEMGICLYVQDALNNCHVFAHLQNILVGLHDHIMRDQLVAHTDNTGTGTSGPHVHYEVITRSPVNFIDKIMYRKELAVIFPGFNTDPILYSKNLYQRFGIDWTTGQAIDAIDPHPNGF